MSKTVRKVSLSSLVLLLGAIGSWCVSAWQQNYEEQQFEKHMKETGIYIYDASFDRTNVWQIAGFILFLVGVSVAIAACMLWDRERKVNG